MISRIALLTAAFTLLGLLVSPLAVAWAAEWVLLGGYWNLTRP